ncbi:MAG: hypothetical protein JW737_01860, partial [Acidobacteria bacterium]|nr:hypothetical protein [Acidobacteriota bacterium]
MNLSSLKKWRMIIPFSIHLLSLSVIFILINDSIDKVEKVIRYLLYPGCILLGFFYIVFDIRDLIWKKEKENYVGSQIKSELIKLVPKSLKCTEQEKEELKDQEIWRELNGIYWDIIDNDSVLKEGKAHFYSNGILYTTVIDVFIILGFISLLCFIYYFFENNSKILISGFFFLIISIICKIV